MESTLLQAAIFRGVDPGAVRGLADRLSTAIVKPGHVFFAQGQYGDRLYVIAEGKVKIGRGSSSSPESIFTVRGPAESFGELSVFDPGPRTSTATALGDVTVVPVDGTVLRSWIGEHPEVADRLLRVLARRLRRTEDTVSDLVLNDVPGRLAKQLLDLAQRFGVQEGGAIRVSHGLTQEELAHLVGSSRQTVNKALADFSQRGWIRLERKGMVISDSERLVRRAR
ncbi:Crp/Fnr family transcriptional regulator [Mycolicibacterium sp. P1-18]|uniref:Crp/Fnr family transcriptional regulator n=1 Tax=Mycolicibacterium sp. P1-18 TaxID=2024615 RepID=UPI0011F1CF80|nr:Crp/Fnr family transcriptional regulator [Mycolicibacterium sp. P1-18]KAA0101864.1 Crp/Fnr family transcriptional regulator [Mycolicibacterium sp. P1-18]